MSLDKKTQQGFPVPDFSDMHDWDVYGSLPMIEYRQSVAEGLNIEKYKDIFSEISKLPLSNIKKSFGDVLYEIVSSAEQKKDYKYNEPSTLDEIRALRKPHRVDKTLDKNKLESQIKGAWVGRICGCMLGKTVECIKTDELIPVLKNSNNYPMHRYILKSDIEQTDISNFKFDFKTRAYADTIDGMPWDDDTNYTVLAQKIIEDYGKDFTPLNVLQAWVKYQPKNSYCTAERVAFCNFINGYKPPYSAVYKNPYREFIGAQIRTDYYGYINPGNPEYAAEMAWRDASISHIKNGIYGAMFVAAALSVAAVTDNMEDIILSGLAEIPHTSRFYEEVMNVFDDYKKGVSQNECFEKIHKKYEEHDAYDWCYTVSNAMIVVASLLYGKGNYGKSICMAVEAGFDTDCNGATVGSIFGMAHGFENIPDYWQKPIGDKLKTTIFGIGTLSISETAKKTMSQIIGL